MVCKHLDTLPCGDSQSMSRCLLHPELGRFQTWSNCQIDANGCADYEEVA